MTGRPARKFSTLIWLYLLKNPKSYEYFSQFFLSEYFHEVSFLRVLSSTCLFYTRNFKICDKFINFLNRRSFIWKRIEFYEFKKSQRKIQPTHGFENQCYRPFVTQMLQPGAAGSNFELDFRENLKTVWCYSQLSIIFTLFSLFLVNALLPFLTGLRNKSVMICNCKVLLITLETTCCYHNL